MANCSPFFIPLIMNLTVALIQTDLHWEQPLANLRMLEEKILGIAPSPDLIVLPEMFSTGFTMNAAALAEPMDGPTVSWMHRMARTKNCVITGSLIIREDNRFYNRLVWMQPDGAYQTYDKRHLFTFAGEHKFYTPGKRHLIVTLKGWKIMPLICYDVRFPVWSRNQQGYDLLLYIASFPDKRIQAWNALLVARAIENQSYTIGVNRVGNDGNGIYHSGHSRVMDYEGNILVDTPAAETIHLMTLSLEKQQKFRESLQFLNDSDSFSLEY